LRNAAKFDRERPPGRVPVRAARDRVRPVVFRFASALGICGVLAVGGAAHAAETTPVRIALETPEGCSSVRAFYAAIRSRTARVHLSTRPKEGLELRVIVTRLPTKFRGELRVVDLAGQSSTREVSGASCEEVVRALSLTAALAVDQLVEPERDDVEPSPTNGANGANGTDSNSGGDAPAAESRAIDESADPDARKATTSKRASEREEEDQDEDEERDEEPERDQASDESDVAVEIDDALDRDAWSNPHPVEVGAQALIGELISPRVSVGGALFVDVTKVVAPPFSPSLGVALAHVPAEFGQSRGDVSIRWTAVLVSACPLRFQPTETISIQPCLAGSGGWLTARGETSEAPATASRSWWSAGVLGRLSAAIGGGTALRFELGLSVPLLRRRFITTPPDETVGESPKISALGALGVAHGF